METAPERRTATLSERVAEEVRAQLGRKRMSQAQLARGVGKTEMWVSLRLRGRQAIDLNDLEAIAGVLGVDIRDLFPGREGRSNQDFDLAPAGAAVTVGQGFVALAERVSPVAKPKKIPQPFGPPKPGPARPVSAVPARKRRPLPVRPGVRRKGE